MIRVSLQAVAMKITALSFILASTCAQGQAQNTPYPRMAPLQQYLMADRRAEIALAQSAAPPAISLHATVLVLTPHGYRVAHKGGNGFTCLVERAWMKPFDDAQFWNWKMRGPTCYNSAASRTILPYTYKRTDMVLAGLTESAIFNHIKAAVADRQLPSPEPGSMAYMMSKDQYLEDAGKSWMPHVMFYSPKADSANDGANWGADRPGSPVLFDNAHHVNPEPWALFFVPVSHWSDGSPAPLMH